MATALPDGSVIDGAGASAPAGRAPVLTLRLARDDRLARMAAAGDTRAFAAIYERYHQPIYRYCHSILHDPDDAADALQNAMVKAMRGLENSKRDIALKPWLFRIAHNEAISLVRRRRPTAELEDGNGPVAHAVEEDAATRERVGQLVTDLKELPERQRGALLMRELAGLEFSEIAETFGVSSAAAKQTVYEARVALHEYAEGRGMRCDDARQSLSAGDRRMLRGRKLAAHLRDCATCRDFEQIMRVRHRDVAMLAPPISAGTSAAVLHGILGGGGGAGGGGGIVGWLTSGGAKALLGSQGAQSMLAAAVVTASAGALVSAIDSQQTGSAGSPAGHAGYVRPASASGSRAGGHYGAGTGPVSTRTRHHAGSSSRHSSSTSGSSRPGSTQSSDRLPDGSRTSTQDAGGTSAQTTSSRRTGPVRQSIGSARRSVGQLLQQVAPAVSTVTAGTPVEQSLPDAALPQLPELPRLPRP